MKDLRIHFNFIHYDRFCSMKKTPKKEIHRIIEIWQTCTCQRWQLAADQRCQIRTVKENSLLISYQVKFFIFLLIFYYQWSQLTITLWKLFCLVFLASIVLCARWAGMYFPMPLRSQARASSFPRLNLKLESLFLVSYYSGNISSVFM